MSIQVMTFEQAEKFQWNPFDLTKVLEMLLYHKKKMTRQWEEIARFHAADFPR